jgi:signal transduction histidine kinase
MERQILVVEDSPTQAQRVRLLLEAHGYRVELASNGREALALVELAPPDLVISDVTMPEMDGYALCRALKSREATRRVPVVLLTERRSAADILEGLEHGADNFIPKPFEDDYLLDRLARIFENLELRAQGRLDVEVSVRFGRRDLTINTDKQQMLELLFSTFDEMVTLNAELEASRRQVEDYARTLEAKVEERTRRLVKTEELDRLKSEFVAAVSHELRTPLTSIRAYAETLRDLAGPDATVQEFLGVIEEESVRLTRLIDDLLNLSRIESGRHTFKQEPVALESLVRHAVQIARPKAAASGVSIATDVAVDLPIIDADADAVQQVLTNLVDNAVKYNRPGGTVHVRAWLAGGVRVEVRDTGIGMSAATVRRLGERFFRVDSSETRRVGGTGLGITLVKEILAAHRSQLEVESEEGVGSSFRFVLPLAGGGA